MLVWAKQIVDPWYETMNIATLLMEWTFIIFICIILRFSSRVTTGAEPCEWWWLGVLESSLVWMVKQGGECVFIILHHTLGFALEIGEREMSFFFLLACRKQLSLLFPILYCHHKPSAHSKVDFIFHLLMQNQYNLARAQQSYKSLVQIHEKNGEWFLSPVSYGVHYWPCLQKPNPSHASKLKLVLVLLCMYQTNRHACSPHLYTQCLWLV